MCIRDRIYAVVEGNVEFQRRSGDKVFINVKAKAADVKAA